MGDTDIRGEGTAELLTWGSPPASPCAAEREADHVRTVYELIGTSRPLHTETTRQTTLSSDAQIVRARRVAQANLSLHNLRTLSANSPSAQGLGGEWSRPVRLGRDLLLLIKGLRQGLVPHLSEAQAHAVAAAILGGDLRPCTELGAVLDSPSAQRH